MRWLAIALCFAVLACERPARVVQSGDRPDEPLILSVLATNDVHGRVDRLPILAGYVDNLRRALGSTGAVLLVDSGDTLHGTLASSLDEGRSIIRAMNAMGYAALALGNHDFDFGPLGPDSLAAGADPHGALRARIAEAAFPVLSANLIANSDAPPDWINLRASALVERAGVRIGLVGVLTEEAPDIIKSPSFAGLGVTPLAPAIVREATLLRERGARLVIVMAHAGVRCRDPGRDSCDRESELFRVARALPANLVDMIAGGHRNGRLATTADGIPLVHVSSGLEDFSRVDFVIDRKTGFVEERRVFPPKRLCRNDPPRPCNPGSYEGRPVLEDERVAAIVNPALARARAALEEPLGVRLATALSATKSAECALGNLFADLMREAVPGAVAAIANAGSLRRDLPAGDLTYGLLYEAMPFDNRLSRLVLTGAELGQVIRLNVSRGEHGLLSLAGLRAKVACDGGDVTVLLFHEDGTPVAEDEELVVATSDFIALGGDDLLTTLPIDASRIQIDTGQSVRDALIAGLKRRSLDVSGDDPAIFDPRRPRIALPEELPVRCHLRTGER